MRFNKRGFSLVELLLVVAIVLVLTAIGTPFLLKSLQQAHNAAALGYLRELQRAQEQYRLQKNEYADTFTKLEGFITADLVIPESLPAPVSLPTLAFAQTETAPGQEAPPPGQVKTLGPEFGASGNQVVRSMYVFSLNRPSTDRWECIAEPVRERTSSFYYFMDDTGVIRFAIGAMPSAASPPLQ